MSDGQSLAASAAVLQVFAFVWGTVWGSFLNVVIYRLPAGGSLVHPPSTCGRCGTRIAWYDNVPVLSYLLLRGRCRACGVAYGPRYALVELLCGVLCLALLRAAVLPLTDVESLVHALWMWLWLQAFVYLLVAITFIDLDHLWIPDELSFLGLIVGFAGAFFLPVARPVDHVFGAFGAAAFMLAIAGLGRLVFGREALGMGDTKLLAMLGAFLGWRALPFILFASAVQALIATLIARIYGRATGRAGGLVRTTSEVDAHFGETDRWSADLPERMVVPYGPFLALAGIEALFFGADLPWLIADRLAALLM